MHIALHADTLLATSIFMKVNAINQSSYRSYTLGGTQGPTEVKVPTNIQNYATHIFMASVLIFLEETKKEKVKS